MPCRHDLTFVDEGKKVLFFYDQSIRAEPAPNQHEFLEKWRYIVRDCLFRELDLTNDWKEVHSWSSWAHIDGNEGSSLGNPNHPEEEKRLIVGSGLTLFGKTQSRVWWPSGGGYPTPGASRER